jgi:metal-responsive CopG/Arc/MetJ family transcriptional regulator
MTGTTTAMKYSDEDKTEKLGITLPVKLLEKIEHIRGDVPRSKFIRRAVESYLKGR